MSTKLLLAVALTLALGLGACRTTGNTGVTPTISTGVLFRDAAVGANRHRFAIYVPHEYTPAKPWPCVVFLNGSGECGTDGCRQLAVGLLPAILAEPQRWPCIVVFPQKPDQPTQWSEHDALVMAALDLARLEFNIDPQRLYLTGLSQGGGGTWTLGAKHADLWAAIVPVCGYGDPAAIAPSLASMPIWAFHGLKDDVVKPAQTTAMIDAIKAEQARRGMGPEPKATLYPDANHNAWDPTYRNEALPKWLLEHRRVK